MNEQDLKARRDQLVDRINFLVTQIPLLQREETACRGQIQLIDELLGQAPAPPGAVTFGDGEPEGIDVTPKKNAAKHKGVSRGKR